MYIYIYRSIKTVTTTSRVDRRGCLPTMSPTRPTRQLQPPWRPRDGEFCGPWRPPSSKTGGTLKDI